MRSFNRPPDDPRSTIELINCALTESDEELAWDAVVALHWRGTREVLDEARSLCVSQCSVERRLGAAILSQLGVNPPTFPNERFKILSGMLRSEKDVDVLEMIFTAFWFLHEPLAIPLIVSFRRHVDPEVRVGVAKALSGHEDAAAIQSLIEMTSDEDPEVRDWATFGLGTLTELDTPEIREALVCRLEDDDGAARGEAQIGLARRQDSRVISSIIASLNAEEVDYFPLEAAELLGDSALHGALIRLRSRQSDDWALLDRAIAACRGTPARP